MNDGWSDGHNCFDACFERIYINNQNNNNSKNKNCNSNNGLTDNNNNNNDVERGGKGDGISDKKPLLSL